MPTCGNHTFTNRATAQRDNGCPCWRPWLRVVVLQATRRAPYPILNEPFLALTVDLPGAAK